MFRHSKNHCRSPSPRRLFCLSGCCHSPSEHCLVFFSLLPAASSAMFLQKLDCWEFCRVSNGELETYSIDRLLSLSSSFFAQLLSILIIPSLWCFLSPCPLFYFVSLCRCLLFITQTLVSRVAHRHVYLHCLCGSYSCLTL